MAFIWQQRRHYGEITPPGRQPGAGNGATWSRSSPFPPRMVQKGARGQEGPFWCTRSWDAAFPPTVSWEEERNAAWLGTRAPGLLGRLCWRLDQAPAALWQEKAEPISSPKTASAFPARCFLGNLLSDTVVSNVLTGLLPTTAAYEEALSDTSGEPMPWSHLRGLRSLGGGPPGNEWACLKFPQAPWWWCDSQAAEPSPPRERGSREEEADEGSGQQQGGLG